MTSQCFSLIGLILNTLGAGILIIPNISQVHYVDDDLIIGGDSKTGKYTQRKHLRERKLNIWSYSFLAVGFIFQIIGILAQ